MSACTRRDDEEACLVCRVQVGDAELAWSNGRRDLCHVGSAPSQPASAPAGGIRQPPQSMMATASGLIARTVSRQTSAETGQLQPEARKSADSAPIPGHILLQQQVGLIFAHSCAFSRSRAFSHKLFR